MNPRPLPSDFLPLTRARRERIERTVDALIAILDADSGDENLECYLAGMPEDDLEGEDEHGGDILDESHDAEPDEEPRLGWPEECSQGADAWHRRRLRAVRRMEASQ